MAFPGERLEVRLALSGTEQFSWGEAPATPVQAANVWSLVDGAGLLDASSSGRLAEAVSIGTRQLTEAVSSPTFDAVAEDAFGVNAAAGIATLRSDIAAGRFSVPLQIVSGQVLGTAQAAYAATGHTGSERIYVNADWLRAGADLGWVTQVLLEEAGHAIDRRLNGDVDAAGDEGKRFATIVVGEGWREGSGQPWLDEDDHGIIVVAGTTVAVEFSNPGDANPVVNLVDTTKTVLENQAASLLFPNATVSDSDSANFDGGVLLLRNLAVGDVVSFSNTTNNVNGTIWRSGDSLMLGNGTTSVAIGSISGGSNASPLSVVFSSTLVTPAVAQATLRAMTFFNNSDAPVTSRELSVVLSDGDGG
ncbi:MAG: hypothetical protein ACKO1M_05405, partial [Planctomycetota bacterium]